MWQLKQFNQLTENMEDGCLITVGDFSENVRIKFQLSPQYSYWNAKSIMLHPTACFHHNPHTREIIKECVRLVTCELIVKHDHFAAAVFCAILTNRNLKLKHHVGGSGGCTSSYKNCDAFLDYSLYHQTLIQEYERHFFSLVIQRDLLLQQNRK